MCNMRNWHCNLADMLMMKVMQTMALWSMNIKKDWKLTTKCKQTK